MALSLASSRTSLASPQFRVVLRQFSNFGAWANSLRSNGHEQGCSRGLLFFSGRQFSRCSEVRKAEVDTGPVKFTESRAFQLGPQIMQTQKKQPWFQMPVIMISMASMLIYFCILREENDMDRVLEGGLYDKVKGLEKSDLLTSIKHMEDMGQDTRKLKSRLVELIKEEVEAEEELRRKIEENS